MCGIAGYLTFQKEADVLTTIHTMSETLGHRGPDGEGFWSGRDVGLAHRRLAIIDLSDSAKQPMHSIDGQVHLVFNGEIYNFRDLTTKVAEAGFQLKSHSDTEVLLCLYHKFGPSAFSMLRGMFAFAIWDERVNSLVLVRDRLGIKPLYYMHNKNGFAFASEIKAIASVWSQLTFNRTSFWKFLRTGTYQDVDTVFNEVSRLQPGSYMTVTKGRVTTTCFWELGSHFLAPPFHFETEGSAINALDEELQESLQYHLVADVPVGGFLSGGLDSSVVMSEMRRVEPSIEISTYAIVFPGQSNQYDESVHAGAVGNLISANHHAIPFHARFLEDLDSLAWYCDEPFGIIASYALYTLAKEASKQVKVVLTGDGGDELLAGYQGYTKPPVSWNGVTKAILRGASSFIHGLSFSGISDASTIAWIKLMRKAGSEGLMYTEQTAYTSALNFAMVNPDYLLEAWKSWATNQGAVSYDALGGSTTLQRMLYSSMKARLVDEMLTKTDRMTMAHSLEARVPLLDHQLVEFCLRLPDELKLRRVDTRYEGKYLLKKVAEKLLPRELIYRQKHSFDVPFSEWLLEPGMEERLYSLLEGVLVHNGVLIKEKVEKLIVEHKMGVHDHGPFLTNVLIFEAWYEAYCKRIPGFKLVF